MIAKKEINKKLLDIISEVKNTKSIKSYPIYMDVLSETEEEIKNNEFKITVVGEFSSGKSTFLNAIIGKDILPHGVKETTATVTYIHNVPTSDALCNKAIIHFSDKSLEDKTLDIGNDRNALVDYVTTSERQYHVVKDIVSVDIYVHFTDVEEPIVLIDTPGMNGVADGHRDITLHEIRHSHASICLFHIRGMGQSDLDFIKELMKYQQTVFFVLNAIDDIRAEEETYEERMQKFNDEIANYVFNGRQKPEYIFGISALKALVARDREIPRLYDKDEKDLTEQDRARLLQESLMLDFEASLFNFLNNSDKEKIFYQSLCKRILQLLESFKTAADTDKNIREVKNDNIPEKKKIQELISKAEKTSLEFKDKLNITLTSMIEDLRNEIYKMIREDITNEYDDRLSEINSLTTIEKAVNETENNVIGKKLNNFWNRQTIMLTDSMRKGLGDIQRSIVIDMQQVIPMITFKDKQFKLDTQPQFDEFDDSSFQSRLRKLRSRKEALERDIRKSQSGESSAELEQQLSSIENEENRLQNEYRARLRRLGSRPSIRYKTIEHKTRKTNSFWTPWHWFSERYETTYETVPDYSARNRYDAEKAQIERDYSSKLREKQNLIRQLQSKVDEAYNNEQMRKLWQSQVDGLALKIQEEERELQSAMSNSRSSFLKKLKQGYQEKLESLLSCPSGQMYADLTDGVRESLQRSKEPMLQELNKIFDAKKKEYINKLQQMISRIDGSENVADNIQQIKILAADLSVIDNNINKLNHIIYGL